MPDLLMRTNWTVPLTVVLRAFQYTVTDETGIENPTNYLCHRQIISYRILTS